MSQKSLQEVVTSGTLSPPCCSEHVFRSSWVPRNAPRGINQKALYLATLDLIRSDCRKSQGMPDILLAIFPTFALLGDLVLLWEDGVLTTERCSVRRQQKTPPSEYIYELLRKIKLATISPFRAQVKPWHDFWGRKKTDVQQPKCKTVVWFSS